MSSKRELSGQPLLTETARDNAASRCRGAGTPVDAIGERRRSLLRTRQRLARNSARIAHELPSYEPKCRAREAMSLEMLTSAESCNAPERIRTSDVRFRRPTARGIDLALESQIKRPTSPNNRQKFDLAAVRAAGAARALTARERRQGAMREAGDCTSSPSGREFRPGGGARLSKEQRRGGPRRVSAAAQIRPTQQRAGAPSSAPGLLLCQEAGVSPCAPGRRPRG
jgi:hypothetical protein